MYRTEQIKYVNTYPRINQEYLNVDHIKSDLLSLTIFGMNLISELYFTWLVHYMITYTPYEHVFDS